MNEKREKKPPKPEGKKRRKITVIGFLIYLVMICLVLGGAYVIIQLTLEKNLENRAFDELRAKVRMQSAVADNLLEKEFTQLRIIDQILSYQGTEIEAAQFQDILETMEEKEHITMLGIADQSGNVFNGSGETVGNVREREYFQEIMEGRATEKCVRLSTTIHSDDPELLYAVPFHIRGEIGGVLFKSKRVVDVEKTLIDDVHFDGCANLFVVDPEGDIILVGDEEDRFLLTDNLFDGCDNFLFTEEQMKVLQRDLKAGASGDLVFYRGIKKMFGVYMPSGVEGWTIFSTVGRDAAAMQYKKSDDIVEKSVAIICVMFAISLLVSIVLLALHIERQKEIRSEYSFQYHGYQKIMRELTYPVFLYDMREDKLTGNKHFKETFTKHGVKDFMQNGDQWRKVHPEYDFDGLFEGIRRATRERTILTFESVLKNEEGKNGWSKSILIPAINEDGSYLMLFGIVMDTTNEHERFEKELEKLQIQLNESRIKISAGQMQPHFLYNALASIREIVLENPEYAADLIFDFTTHLRACIKSMGSEEMIPFSQEIENIKAYVNIEKMRFGDKMQVEYDVQEDDFPIVPLSVQPLVENAIRHGIYERGSQGGTVWIRSYQNGDSIVIQVEDNGVGFDVEKIRQEVESHTRDSAGLQSLVFRFEHLMNAKVQIESIIGEGTKVTIMIPKKGETPCEQ